MLRLNASVHSWLTRHEKRKQLETSNGKIMINSSPSDNGNHELHDENGNAADESALELSTSTLKETETSKSIDTSTEMNDWTVDEDLHKQLKNEVGNMYKVWDEADQR